MLAAITSASTPATVLETIADFDFVPMILAIQLAIFLSVDFFLTLTGLGSLTTSLFNHHKPMSQDPLISMTVTRSKNRVSLIAECSDVNFADIVQSLFIVLMNETIKKLAPNKQ